MKQVRWLAVPLGILVTIDVLLWIYVLFLPTTERTPWITVAGTVLGSIVVITIPMVLRILDTRRTTREALNTFIIAAKKTHSIVVLTPEEASQIEAIYGDLKRATESLKAATEEYDAAWTTLASLDLHDRTMTLATAVRDLWPNEEGFMQAIENLQAHVRSTYG